MDTDGLGSLCFVHFVSFVVEDEGGLWFGGLTTEHTKNAKGIPRVRRIPRFSKNPCSSVEFDNV